MVCCNFWINNTNFGWKPWSGLETDWTSAINFRNHKNSNGYDEEKEMRRFLGIFNTKKMNPEQIYERVIKTVQEKDRLELIEMAKKMGKKKK